MHDNNKLSEILRQAGAPVHLGLVAEITPTEVDRKLFLHTSMENIRTKFTKQV